MSTVSQQYDQALSSALSTLLGGTTASIAVGSSSVTFNPKILEIAKKYADNKYATHAKAADALLDVMTKELEAVWQSGNAVLRLIEPDTASRAYRIRATTHKDSGTSLPDGFLQLFICQVQKTGPNDPDPLVPRVP